MLIDIDRGIAVRMWKGMTSALCMLRNFSQFLAVCSVLRSNFLKNSCRNTIRMSNSLNPDKAKEFVRPDLESNCLQKLSADNTTIYKELTEKLNSMYSCSSLCFEVKAKYQMV